MGQRERRGLWADAAMGSGILLLGAGLAAAGAVLQSQQGRAAARHEEAALDGLLAAAASLAGTAITIWWLLGLTLAFCAAVLRRNGHLRLARKTERFSPAFFRRLMVALLGVQLIAAPFASAADDPPEPAWSVSPPAGTAAPSLAPPSPAPPSPAAPSRAAAGTSGTAPTPLWRPLRPVAPPGLLAPAAPRSSTPAGSHPAGAEVVRDGDCLWSIAARQLGPDATDVDIARAWPKWHAVNLAVIGEDPNRILPGQALVPPLP